MRLLPGNVTAHSSPLLIPDTDTDDDDDETGTGADNDDARSFLEQIPIPRHECHLNPGERQRPQARAQVPSHATLTHTRFSRMTASFFLRGLDSTVHCRMCSRIFLPK